jgi:hypothetical protein
VRRVRRRNASACTRALRWSGVHGRTRRQRQACHHRQLACILVARSSGHCWPFSPFFCLAFLHGATTRRPAGRMATFFNPFVRARPAVTEGELNLFVRCLQRREIYPLPFNGARGGMCFTFHRSFSSFTRLPSSLALTVKAGRGRERGNRAPGPVRTPILFYRRTDTPLVACVLPWTTSRRIPCSISLVYVHTHSSLVAAAWGSYTAPHVHRGRHQLTPRRLTVWMSSLPVPLNERRNDRHFRTGAAFSAVQCWPSR